MNRQDFFEAFSKAEDHELNFPLSISQLANAADTSVHTIRNYRTEGLLDCSERTANGYGLYQSCALHRLRFLRAAMTAGLLIADIKPLLQRLDSDDGQLSSAIDELKLKVVKRKGQLQRLENKISGLVGGIPLNG